MQAGSLRGRISAAANAPWHLLATQNSTAQTPSVYPQDRDIRIYSVERDNSLPVVKAIRNKAEISLSG